MPAINRTVVALGALLMASSILSGCASLDAHPDTKSLPTSSRLADIKGTRLCITNESSHPARVTWGSDAKPTEFPPPAYRVCREGYESGGTDIRATLEYAITDGAVDWVKWEISATNDWIGPPYSVISFSTSAGDRGLCDTFYVGDTHSLQDGMLRGEVKRYLDKPAAKALELTITDGDGSIDGSNLADCQYR